MTRKKQKPHAFERFMIKQLEIHILRMNKRLMQADDLMDSKVQSLYRLMNQSLRTRVSLQKSLQDLAKNVKKSQKAIKIPDHWRTNIAAFANEALNVSLFDHQINFCESTSRTVVMIAGRGAGKSVAARVRALFNACCNPNHTVLVVSSGQRMSSDFGTKLVDLVRETPIIQHVSVVSGDKISFKNGSVIKLLPANPDTIRGYHPKTGQCKSGITAILDEACFMEHGDEIRKAVEYAMITTTPENGRLYIVSSPSTIGSWVYPYVQNAENPEAGIEVINVPSTANPNISQDEIERLRQTKNDLEFRAEVLGEWVDGAFGLFSGVIDPNIIESDEYPVPQHALCGLGADLALSFSANHDNNALAVIAKWWDSEEDVEPTYRLVDLVVLSQASDREVREVLDQLDEKWKIDKAIIEQCQGKALAEYSQSCKIETEIVAPTLGNQQEIFHELHRMLRQNKLQLPKSLPEQFFAELRAFEYRREPNGHIIFGHPSTGKMHDDTVYATAWALKAAQTLPPPTPPTPFIMEFVPKRKFL